MSNAGPQRRGTNGSGQSGASSAATARARQYATRFEAGNEAVIATVEGCTDEEWRRIAAGEERPVGVVAHHLAVSQQMFAEFVAELLANTASPLHLTLEAVNRGNAEHARDYAGVGKEETLDALRSSGALMRDGLNRLDDESLDRTIGTLGGNDVTLAQLLDGVVIGHTAQHLASIRAALA